MLLSVLIAIAVDSEGANWNYKTGWLFGGLGVLTCVVVWFFVPEPAQRNAAEMDEMYEKGVPAWKMRKYVTDVQRTQQEILHGQGGNIPKV